MKYSNLFEGGASPEIGENCHLANDIIFNRFVTIGSGSNIAQKVKIGFNTTIGKNVIIEAGVCIGNNSTIWDNVTVKSKTIIENNVEVGYANLSRKKEYYKAFNTEIGEKCIIRSGAIIYTACKIGNKSWIGNYTIIRENTVIGSNTTFGSHIMCEGYSVFGNNNKVYSFCELGGNMVVEDYVFIGPGTITANNPRPIMGSKKPTTSRWEEDNQKVVDQGPVIRKGAKIGIAATLLAQIEIGKDALVAAGSVVTKNVPDCTIVKGIPARVSGVAPVYERLNHED